MKFLWYNPPVVRSTIMTFDNYITKGGFSGTEGSILSICKRLAESGHDVSITCDVYQTTFIDSYGIRYLCPVDILRNVYDCSDIDVFLPNFTVLDGIPVEVYKRMKKGSTVVPWNHWIQDPTYIARYMDLLSPFFNVISVGPSEFSLKYVPNGEGKVIPHGIEESMVVQSSSDRRRGHWVFHTSFSRGGDVCAKVFSSVKKILPEAAQRLDFMSYYIPDAAETYGADCHFNASVDKKTLFSILSCSDYFVYPLVDAKTGSVHHDTYACCVLEALACGMIVVSWDVACMREVYGDNVVLVPPIPYPKYDAQDTHPAPNPLMAGEQGVRKLTQVILDIESQPDVKESLRRKGKEWALRQTYDNAFNKLLILVRNHLSDKSDEVAHPVQLV